LNPPSDRPRSSRPEAVTGGTPAPFGLLDADGRIVSVNRAWRDVEDSDAPFGSSFPVGARYQDLCDGWGRPRGAALSEAVRAVLAGERDEARVAYEYPGGGGSRRSEMQVSRFDLGGATHALVLHRLPHPERDENLLHRLRGAGSSVGARTTSLARQAPGLVGARERAVETMRIKAELMTNLSHEIRTPLNGIIGMTDLALETDLNDEQSEYLTAVHSAAHSLLALLNNILDFPCVDSDRIILAEVPFRPNDLVAATLGPLEPRARGKGLDLSCEMDPGIPDRLIGDPGRLGQILHNLVDNAIKFTERGGIAVRAVQDRLSDGRMSIRFDVVDSGIGVDPSLHERIFESFAQADGSSTRRYGGTGLGLTLSSRLVALMGGHLRVESRAGRGSTFSFTLSFRLGNEPRLHPLPGEADDARARVAPAVSDRGSTVPLRARPRSILTLVAEDNPVGQRIARSALERAGHRVEIVDNGKDAVHLATSGQFGLVFMDIEMPVLDGFGATALIREHEKGTGGHLPIVGMIDPTVPPDRERFRRAGMDDVLAKPFDQETLEAMLLRYGVGTDAERAPTETEELRRPELPFVDGDRLLEQSGGAPQLLAELVELFMEERATMLEPVVRAIERWDPRELEQAAHRLRGTFGSLAAPRATEAARRLELIARAGDPDLAQAALTSLRCEVDRLEDELQAVAKRAF
jgi:signal transduction histidine kinase/CheY-like chemotaxis protein